MKTGERIKAKRTELGMTQEELAEKLHVSRSTVSNWEIDRNYPDIQSILQISQVLDISLDSLFKEGDGAEIIEADKKIRRKQKRKIRLLLLLVILIIGVTATLQIGRASELRYPGQISSVEVKNNGIEIRADIPFYRSVGGYYMDENYDDEDTVNISVFSSIDLTMKHVEILTLHFDPKLLDKNIKTVNIVNDNKIVKTIEVKK